MILYLIIIVLVGFFGSFIVQKSILKVIKNKTNIENIFNRNDKRNCNEIAKPRVGGIGIYLGLLLAFFMFSSLLKTEFLKNIKILGFIEIHYLLISLTIIFILGLIDDLFGLNAWQKLPFEIIAALVIFFNGFTIKFIFSPIGSQKIVLSFFLSLLISILWIIGITNALNLIDGIDGLAGGIASISIISFMILSFINNKPELLLLSSGVLGATLGFLYFNIFPAKLYMGDSGSLMLGFFLGALSLKASSKASFGITFVIPIAILFLPILDIVIAFFRRIIKHRNPFIADTEHIHHKLLLRGFNEKKVFFFLLILSFFFSAIGIISFFFSKTVRGFIFLFIISIGILLLINLKYINLNILKKNAGVRKNSKDLDGYKADKNTDTNKKSDYEVK